jgi:hypothetical protein
MRSVRVLDVPVGNKFAMIALATVSTPEILFPLWFDGTLWALSRPLLEFDSTWRSWLGLRADELANSNLFLVATTPSKAPEILDEEHQRLERKARFVFLALAIAGLYLERPGLVLQGSRLQEPFGLQIRSVHDTMPIFRLEGSQRMAITLPRLLIAARMAWHMRDLTGRRPVPRLWRGIRSLISGIEARAGEDRLHGFVRALEAVTEPPRGEGERKFVHRCSTFAGRQERDRELLRELFRLRSAAEHLHNVPSALVTHPLYERERIALYRTEQAEVLARFVYVTILSSDELTALFADDGWLDQLWALPDDEVSKFWGPSINLHKIPPPALRLDQV